MPSVGDIQINLNFDDKSKLKLRAIAKYVGALADELDAIDAMNEDELPTRLEGTD